MERPLKEVTLAVERLAAGQRLSTLPETGPEETRLLLRTVNSLVERLHGVKDNRRRLLSNLIHELGRPLGAVRAAVHALKGGAAEDPALSAELLSGINQQLRGLQRLVDDLGQLQDRLLGAVELHREPVELEAWLPGVLRPWAEMALSHQLHWQAVVEHRIPSVVVDPDRLGQAIGNLLSNAVKYTPPGGTIRVTAAACEGAVRLTVEDDGPGIVAGEQEAVFEPFYRSQAKGRFPQGMGLGLAIARDLVIAHGGRLELESTPGAGSRFTIDLPVLERQRR